MDYKIVSFPKDKIYVGMRFCNEESNNYNDMASFWSYFTEKLYSSKIANNLIDNNEAIGYRKYNTPSDSSSYDYYAACETEYPLEEANGFDKIIIPKGDYILFKVSYKSKEKEIKEIVEHLNELTEYSINTQFDFEYYTADFYYKDINTHLYLVVQILGKY